MLPMRVYLAGGIFGLGDGEVQGWRDFAKTKLADVRDPMVRDYRGIEASNVRAIVHGDLDDIDACTHMLAMCTRPSWGTAMEIRYAYEHGLLVYGVVLPGQAVSPWLAYHCISLHTSLEAAITVLLRDQARRDAAWAELQANTKKPGS